MTRRGAPAELMWCRAQEGRIHGNPAHQAWRVWCVCRVRISIETHKTSPDFDQTAADKVKNRIKQALGEIGCDVFIETDR